MAGGRQPIVITYTDRSRLERLLDALQTQAAQRQEYLKALAGELGRARTVSPAEVPADVVTMNSTVRLRDLSSGECRDYTLVYPARADIAADRISVLAPVGTAIIGQREGDTIEWRVPAGLRRLKVEEVVYQPERAGVFDH